MKKILSFFLLISGFQIVAYAQPSSRENVLESLRIAFLTRQLELSPAEAEKFWPVYNKYHGDIRRVAQEHRENKFSELDREEKILHIRKQYKQEFSNCIGPQKFDRLMKAERNWGDLLRQELRRRNEMPERPAAIERQGMRPRGRNF